MPKAHNPRRGSMQFWPRKRSRHSLVRVRSWAQEGKVKPLGFIGYKAGMTHLQVTDNRPKALTKGETVMIASTIVDCPPMNVVGVCFYKNYPRGTKKFTSVLAEKPVKELAKKIQLPKKTSKKIDDVKEFDDLKLLVHSNPKFAKIGTKKPKIIEIAVGGSNEEKLNYAKEVLGKEIKIQDVFENGNSLDVHGVTKGKGFQGTVKRYGVPIKQHKGEKNKRGIGNLGAWTPKRVQFQVAQPGKMGYHLRTEYNVQVIKVGEEGKELVPKGGLRNYGSLNNSYLLLKGSVVGPKRRAVMLVSSIRKNKKMTKEAPQVTYVSLTN
jgi:large subunit ribosomal protein L3